jgi:hypothetical protein
MTHCLDAKDGLNEIGVVARPDGHGLGDKSFGATKNLLGALPPDQSLGHVPEALPCLRVLRSQAETSAEIKPRQFGVTIHGLHLLTYQEGATGRQPPEGQSCKCIRRRVGGHTIPWPTLTIAYDEAFIYQRLDVSLRAR